MKATVGKIMTRTSDLGGVQQGPIVKVWNWW